VYGNSTSGYNVTDMTPRRWSGAPTMKPTAKPSSSLVANVTYSPASSPSIKVTFKPTGKKLSSFPTHTVIQSVKPTTRPTVKASLKRSARPTAKSTVLSFNLIITEITDPKDKYISFNKARYVELYSVDGAGQTINDTSLYLLRWTNARAG
jgi:hypothetical protein